MAGSGSAIKEGDLAPMCFQLIDFQMVAKLTVPGPFQPHRTLCETGTKKKEKSFDFSSVVDYHTDLSNFYASYARLLRGVRFFEKAGYHFTLTDDV